MSSLGRIFLAYGLLGSLVAPAGAAAPGADPDLWRESPGFLVTVNDSGEAGGEVFHSPDFRQLLVLPDRGADAYILGVANLSVAAVRRTETTVTEEGVTLATTAKGRSLDGFERTGPEISFRDGAARFLLSPAKPLVGEATLATVLARKQEYAATAKTYTPDPAAVLRIRACAAPTEFVVFFGTWCEVCRKRVPAFIRTIEDAGNPNLRVRFICITARFTEPRPLIDQYKVQRTPTFIVLRDGVEIGRVDKAPAVTLEQSLADILDGPR